VETNAVALSGELVAIEPLRHTPAGIQSFDAQARANVADEIRRLREGC